MILSRNTKDKPATEFITDLGKVLAKGEPWPPLSERNRLRTYYENTLLFEGHHHEVYRESSKLIRPELNVANLFVVNWQKRLTRMWVGMMLGEPPKFTAGEPNSTEQTALNEMLERNKFMQKLTMNRIDVSRYGDGLFKVWLKDGQARVDVQTPQVWFPVVNSGNVTEITAHVLAYKVIVRNRYFIRIEVHTPGRIENYAYTSTDADLPQIGTQVTLETVGEERPEIEILPDSSMMSVVRIPNLLTSTSPYGFNDYDDLDSIVLEIESRLAQMSKILDKHAEPGMYGPETALEYDHELRQWRFKKAGYLVVEEGDSTPGYLTWDGSLTDSLAMLNQLTETLFSISETSPANFGLIKSGLAESGSALKRLLMASITKNNLVRMSYDEGLKELFRIMSAFERQDFDVSIDWKDGLPQDDTEDAENDSKYRTTRSRSLHQSIKAQHPEWEDDQIEEEIQRIQEEAAQESAINPVGSTNLFNNPRAE
jgi:hypothetical protein